MVDTKETKEPSTKGNFIRDALIKLGLPDPDNLLAELKRLNNNMEEMMPAFKKLSQLADRDTIAAIETITQTLQGIHNSIFGE